METFEKATTALATPPDVGGDHVRDVRPRQAGARASLLRRHHLRLRRRAIGTGRRRPAWLGSSSWQRLPARRETGAAKGSASSTGIRRLERII
jgi:hypothetical protein